ncbi:MAG TPA: ABC transporter permease, partial [Casimicrobiaceae bacterium]
MNTLALAWRNLLRNRRRSLMTLVAMLLGLVAVLLFGGYVTDIKYGMQSEFVRRTGHLQIQHRDYFRLGSGNPAAYGIAGYERIIDAVRNDPILAPMLTVVTPTLHFGGIAGNFAASVSRTVYVSGSVVEDQNRMNEWNDYEQRILWRPMSLSGTASDAAVIGTGVARVLQLCAALEVPDCASEPARPDSQGAALPDDIVALSDPGKRPVNAASGEAPPRIEILAATARGAPNVAAVNVLHAEFQGIKELDDVYVGLHLAQAQKLVFGAGPAQVTAIAVQLRHTTELPAARERLEELLKTTLKDQPL